MLARFAIFLNIFVVLLIPERVFAFRHPDTGQTKCYQDNSNVEMLCDNTGQDGAYNINPMSYVILGTNNDMVEDNNTGLVWQRQADGNKTWDQAAAYCNGLDLEGYTDWRLPSKKELISIVNFGMPIINFDTTIFKGSELGEFWSSTSYISNPALAWHVGWCFIDGHDKSALGYVRCVRGPEHAIHQFTDNGSTVTDRSTGLEWQKGEGGYMTWGAALTYCEGLSLASKDDWRLPNIKELESLTDDTKQSPAIDTNFFPRVLSTNYWSSTSLVTTVPSQGIYAWNVSFDYGFDGGYDKSDTGYVRCVRGGQSGSVAGLSISKTGTGTGFVLSSPIGINCDIANTTCAAYFPADSVVTLSATPALMGGAGGSILTKWDGDTACLKGQVTMSADKSCIANFDLCQVKPAAIGSATYNSVSEAYIAASLIDYDVIKIIAYNRSEIVYLTANKSITLSGGYDCAYNLLPLANSIIGQLTLSDGSVTMDRITIQ